MTLQQIYYALIIADIGSMSKAAEKLYISQPTLTNAIKELENEIKIIIFNRSSRGVTLTNEGSHFIKSARQLYQQYENLQDTYSTGKNVRHTFGVSTQHYSFAIKAFVETVKKYDTIIYDFAIRETRTRDVVNDVSSGLSEVGILYLSNYNRKYFRKIFETEKLEFHHLTECSAFVYLYKKHPLAGNESISFEELQDYPCLSFEQGNGESQYLAEEILSENVYKRSIKAYDRATMLNLMVGLNAYTLCSGIICEELNGSDYVAVPFKDDEENPNCIMDIGYITKKNFTLSSIGEDYVIELKKYLQVE